MRSLGLKFLPVKRVQDFLLQITKNEVFALHTKDNRLKPAYLLSNVTYVLPHKISFRLYKEERQKFIFPSTGREI